MRQHPSRTSLTSVERAAQIFALSVGFAGASLPAAAQSADTKNSERVSAVAGQTEPEPSHVHSPLREVRATEGQLSNSDSQANLQILPSTEKGNPWSRVFSTLSGALSLVSMGWYYRQLNRKETAVSVPSVGLQSINDVLLCVAAVVNHQGWGAIATAAVFGAGGFACLRSAIKANRENPNKKGIHFSRDDLICAAGCAVGWAALIASWTPQLATMFGKGVLEIAGSWIATATYILASRPVMKTMLAWPEPHEVKSVVDRPWWAVTKTAAPYILGTMALGLAVAAIPKFNLASGPQPVALLINNVLLTTFIVIWGARRISAAPPKAPSV